MARSTIVIALAMAALLLTPAAADTHTACGRVQTSFSFCVAYLMGVDRSMDPNCCAGMKDVNEVVSGGEIDDAAACRCLQGMFEQAGGSVRADLVGAISRNCGVSPLFPIPTASSFNCGQ